MSARSSGFAVARTTSQGSRRSRMTRSSTWGNSRFAEGPPVQPRSELKELGFLMLSCFLWMDMDEKGAVKVCHIRRSGYIIQLACILVDVVVP